MAPRFLGMAVSWIGFTACVVLLFLSMRAVLAVGGYCAEGGPYQVAVHCPGSTAGFLTIAVWAGLAFLGVSVYLARGLGASLVMWSVPMVSFALGYDFLDKAIAPGLPLDVVGVVVGAMFVVAGVVPLWAWLRVAANRRAFLVGTVTLAGENLGDVDFGVLASARSSAAKPLSGMAMPPTDAVVLLFLWLVEVAGGACVGILVFNAF